MEHMERVSPPLFEWPNIGKDNQTWDPVNKRYVYPFRKTTKRTKRRIVSAEELKDLTAKVTAVVDYVKYDSGNIIQLIVNELTSAAAEEERILLPKLSYVFSYHNHEISKECVNMMKDKMQRALRQHAHNLAMNDEIDIAMYWYCGDFSKDTNGERHDELRVRWVPENEAPIVQEAWNMHYKPVSYDMEHYKEKPEDENPKKLTGILQDEEHKPSKKPNEIAEPTRRGGCYACVPKDFYKVLCNLSPSWGIWIETIVTPKLMTNEEEKEMIEYHATRKRKEDQLLAEEQERNEDVEFRLRAAKEHQNRREATYETIYKECLERFKRVNAHVDQGAM